MYPKSNSNSVGLNCRLLELPENKASTLGKLVANNLLHSCNRNINNRQLCSCSNCKSTLCVVCATYLLQSSWVSNWVQLSCKTETLFTFRKFQQQLAKTHFVAIDCAVELQAAILSHTEPRGALEDRTASGGGYKSYGIELGSSDKRPVTNCRT